MHLTDVQIPGALDTLSMSRADTFQLLCHLHSHWAAAHEHSAGPSWRVLEQSSFLERPVGTAQHHAAHAVPACCPPAGSSA